MRYSSETYVVTAGILFAIAMVGIIAFLLVRKGTPQNGYEVEVRSRRMMACAIFSLIFLCLAAKNTLQFLLNT